MSADAWDGTAETFAAMLAEERRAKADATPGAVEYIPGDDPVELRDTKRMTFTSKPTVPGIKGGQGRSGAEIESTANKYAWITPWFILGFCIGSVIVGIVWIYT